MLEIKIEHVRFFVGLAEISKISYFVIPLHFGATDRLGRRFIFSRRRYNSSLFVFSKAFDESQVKGEDPNHEGEQQEQAHVAQNDLHGFIRRFAENRLV